MNLVARVKKWFAFKIWDVSLNDLNWPMLEMDKYFGDATLMMRINKNKFLQIVTVIYFYLFPIQIAEYIV